MTAVTAVRTTAPDPETGIAIARDIARSAIWHGDICTFQGAVPADEIGLPPLYATTGGDVYEGTAGVARFLILAARFSSRDAVLIETSRGALLHAIRNAGGVSVFSGIAGTAVVALESGFADMRGGALEMLDAAVASALADPNPPADLLSGLAGLIIALDYVARRDSDGPWSAHAAALGHRLIETARADRDGMSWPVTPGHKEHLCGLAHGAAGVAYAMERLGDLAPEISKWRDTARRARNFERCWYAPEHGSWADLRSDAVGPDETIGYPHMWCHGSIGIAADRLLANPGDLLARVDRVAALEGVLASTRDALSAPRGPGGSDAINGSQCHGLSGVSDLMIDAWLRSGEAVWRDVARACMAAMRDDARRPEGWRCGVPGGHTSPGLMLGKAGIGWAMLRAAHPETVPSAWKIGGLL